MYKQISPFKIIVENYKPALKNMHKATIDGENLIEDDELVSKQMKMIKC